MPSTDKILLHMAIAPRSVRFADLMKVCRLYFGEPRIKGSHHVFKAPGSNPPIVDIQPQGTGVKLYQVRQVLSAIREIRERNKL